jgi:hypothetical protein
MGHIPGFAAGRIQAPEYELKAAWLHKFGLFTEWPAALLARPTDPFIIGIVGEDPFGESLEKTLRSETVYRRPLVLVRSRSEVPKQCHILFVATSEQHRLKEILDAARLLNILTVGESEGFCRQGGCVEFVSSGKTITFVINLQAAERARLRLDPGLISISRSVIR